MLNHNIRKAIKEDVSDILRLLIELAVFEKEPDAVKVTEEQLIEDGFGDKPRYECFLAEVENEIVGLAFFTSAKKHSYLGLSPKPSSINSS